MPHFLKQRLGQKPGKIIDVQGDILGRHQGLHFYTLGQRKGLGLSGGPYFVKDFDSLKNALVVTKTQKEIFKKEVKLYPFNFISSSLPKKKIRVMAKVRYQQLLARATLFPSKEGRLRLVFDKLQRAITPGQFAVFYKGDVCLGGGRIIEK